MHPRLVPALLLAALSLAISALHARPAVAQPDPGLAGQWQCEYSRMPLSKQDASGRFIRAYFNLDPSGGFAAQGSIYSPWTGVDEQIQVQGQWYVDTQSRGVPHVVLNGQYPFYQGAMVPFYMFARVIDARNMVLQERDHTHTTAVACRR